MTYALDMAVVATPVGPIQILGDLEKLHSVRILTGTCEDQQGVTEPVVEAARQIRAWFKGMLREFDLPLTVPTTTRGQELREGLIQVPYGSTLTYGALSSRLRSSPRAIGQLCARNPFPIIVPCHRVVSRGATAENYSAGAGATTKAWLLAHEKKNLSGA